MSRLSRFASLMFLKYGQSSDPEADIKLKKRFETSKYSVLPEFKAMVNRNIIPVVAMRGDVETPLLGEGVFSQVFEVSYHGKLAVAKLTASKKDYDILINLEEIRQSLGSDAKHVAKLLDHFVVPSGLGLSYIPIERPYISIVEKLEVLPAHLLKSIFESLDPKHLSFQDEFDIHKAIEELNRIIKLHSTDFTLRINDAYNAYSEETKKILRIIKNDVAEKIINIYMAAYKNANSPSEFLNVFTQNTNQLNNDLISKDNIAIIFSFIKNVVGTICSYTLSAIRFPVYAPPITKDKPNIKYFLDKPETKDFMRFLLRLRKEFAVDWYDLHSANVMFRPQTGDLVVSDPGMFIGI